MRACERTIVCTAFCLKWYTCLACLLLSLWSSSSPMVKWSSSRYCKLSTLCVNIADIQWFKYCTHAIADHWSQVTHAIHVKKTEHKEESYNLLTSCRTLKKQHKWIWICNLCVLLATAHKWNGRWETIEKQSAVCDKVWHSMKFISFDFIHSNSEWFLLHISILILVLFFVLLLKPTKNLFYHFITKRLS